MDLDQVVTVRAPDDDRDSVVEIEMSTPGFPTSSSEHVGNEKRYRNPQESSNDLASTSKRQAPDSSRLVPINKSNGNEIPVPQRTSSKLLNLPKAANSFVKKIASPAFDDNSTNKYVGMGCNPDSAGVQPNESAVNPKPKEINVAKINAPIGWNPEVRPNEISVNPTPIEDNSAKLNSGIEWNAGSDGVRSNELAVKTNEENSAIINAEIGWNPDGARPRRNILPGTKILVTPTRNDEIGWSLNAPGSLPKWGTNEVLFPPTQPATSPLNFVGLDPSRKTTPQKIDNDIVTGDNSPATQNQSGFQYDVPGSLRQESNECFLNPPDTSYPSDSKTSEATVQPTSKTKPSLYSNASNATSKVKLNILLESMGDRVSSAAGLAQFPLSLSTASLNRTADKVDGAVNSKGVRNRAQERRNADLLSAVFYSKPAEEILKLLEKGADIRTKCRDSGASLLHVAALNADADIVELLVSKGCDVRNRDRGGKQPVHVAAWEGALKVLQVLCQADSEMMRSKVEAEVPYINRHPDSWNHKHEQINKYWNVMEVITTGSTPLHVACRRTKESCVKFLIDAGAEPEEDAEGLYPVDVIGMDVGEDPANRASDSSEGSTVGIAKLLIGHQKRNASAALKSVGETRGWPRVRRLFSVEDHDKRPVTALHTAVSENNLNLISILLDEGADVLVWNEGGATPLHLAVKKKFADALCIMLRHGDNRERRAVDAVDMRDRSLLSLAVDEEWIDGISILLEENADITCKNAQRETVLHLVAANGNLKILTELLTVPDVSVIINAVDNDCYTPIHKAVEYNHQKIMELLIINGAKAEVILPDGRTLLHICAKNNAEDLMKYLMDSTKVVKMKENKTSVGDGGMTAMHIAACLGHASIVELLVKHGCNIGTKTEDGTGSTALHLAAKFDHKQVLCTILELDQSGTTLETKDDHGWYPLHIAAGHGHEECVDMLLRAGADIALTVEDEQGTKFTGLDIIMTCVHRPVDFLVKILDSYIIVDSKIPVTNPQCKIEVDFDFLLPSPPEGKQLQVLEAVLNNGSEDLEEAFFLHPIVQTFIYLKSKNMFLFFALFFDLFFLLAFYLSVMAYHGAETLQQPLYRYILIGLLSINMLFEVINIVRLQRYYVKDPETWIKWIVYSNILVIVIHPTQLVLRYNMAVSILLSWTELLLIIAKYPAWGIYVLMFATVAGTILKVLAVFSLLLVGFAFTFRALFQEKGPFSTVWSSMVKVLIMVYELDYRGTMEETYDEGPMFTDIARFFYLLFVLMVSMSLVNLMLGLAVSDIADLKRKGRAKRLAKQVAFLGGLENLLFCWPLGSLPLMLRYRKAPSSLVVKAGSKLSGARDSPVPKKLKESIIDKARLVQQANQRPVCSPIQTSMDNKLKDNSKSITTRRSISSSLNRVLLDR